MGEIKKSFEGVNRPKGGPPVTEKEFEAAVSYLWQQAGRTPEASQAANDIRLFLFERTSSKQLTSLKNPC